MTTIVRIRGEDKTRIHKLYPGLPISNGINMLLKEHEENIIRKTDIFTHINSKFEEYVYRLEGRLKKAIGEF